MAYSSAAPELTPEQKFPPFPLRTRSNMEIFDAAIKLYKQYFWVLLGWSALVTGVGLIGATSCGGMVSFFLSPLFIGAISCCIAAAVRGQQVTFNQCWKFTQPRYGAILGMYLLSSLIGGLACAVVFGVAAAIFVGGAIVLTNAATAVQVIMAILGVLVIGTIVAVIATVFVTWMTLVPIVVCLEEDKRNTQALGRAYDLLRGRWISVSALMTVVGLSALALMMVLGGFAVIALGPGALRDLMAGREPSPGALMLMFLSFFSSFSLIGILFTPLYDLIIAVYYLDLRVRKEALDLEWAAHTTAPQMPPAPQTPPAPPVESMIAPDESWNAPGAFVPEPAPAPTQSGVVQPSTPPAPTSPVQTVDTSNYSPHITRPLDTNEETSPPEYSTAATTPAVPTDEAITTEPAASPFYFDNAAINPAADESETTGNQSSDPQSPDTQSTDTTRW